MANQPGHTKIDLDHPGLACPASLLHHPVGVLHGDLHPGLIWSRRRRFMTQTVRRWHRLLGKKKNVNDWYLPCLTCIDLLFFLLFNSWSDTTMTIHNNSSFLCRFVIGKEKSLRHTQPKRLISRSWSRWWEKNYALGGGWLRRTLSFVIFTISNPQ